MGRASPALTIVVAEQWESHPEIEGLRAVGHLVVPWLRAHEFPAPDLILHPAAHGWNDLMWDYLPAALTAARKRFRERRRAK